MADLKSKLDKEAKEAAKQKMIEELGEDGYVRKMAAEQAAMRKKEAEEKAAKEKKEAKLKLKAAKEEQRKADKLYILLNNVMAASEGGVSSTLNGVTITVWSLLIQRRSTPSITSLM
jgi:membrane protein involved in colicin uptake